MKLHVVIADKPFQDILSLEKKAELRQIESIVFVDENGVKRAEFEVKFVKGVLPIRVRLELKKYGLEGHYDPDLPAAVMVGLGDIIKDEEHHKRQLEKSVGAQGRKEVLKKIEQGAQ